MVVSLIAVNLFPSSVVAFANVKNENFVETNMKRKAAHKDEERIHQLLYSVYVCDYCYGNAIATCNGERTKGDTRYHGKNCGYTTYYSTVRVKCNYCFRSYNLSNSRHACLETHTTCGSGSVVVSPFR